MAISYTNSVFYEWKKFSLVTIAGSILRGSLLFYIHNGSFNNYQIIRRTEPVFVLIRLFWAVIIRFVLILLSRKRPFLLLLSLFRSGIFIVQCLLVVVIFFYRWSLIVYYNSERSGHKTCLTTFSISLKLCTQYTYVTSTSSCVVAPQTCETQPFLFGNIRANRTLLPDDIRKGVLFNSGPRVKCLDFDRLLFTLLSTRSVLISTVFTNITRMFRPSKTRLFAHQECFAYFRFSDPTGGNFQNGIRPRQEPGLLFMNKTMDMERVIFFLVLFRIHYGHGESIKVIESRCVHSWQARLRTAVQIISMLTCKQCHWFWTSPEHAYHVTAWSNH